MQYGAASRAVAALLLFALSVLIYAVSHPAHLFFESTLWGVFSVESYAH